MSDIADQIASIEKELRETPHHKGTDHHIGLLRARVARLKDKQSESATKAKGGGGGGGYAVKKQGDATIILVGPPSAGKSTLINKLTNAQSKVAPYAFTTVSVIPGMMSYKNAQIQILDVPGLIEGAEKGKGRGREVLSVARGADLLILITDIKRVSFFDKIEEALFQNGIRINSTPPKVKTEKKIAGGIIVHSNLSQKIEKPTVAAMAGEFGIKNAEITLQEVVTSERLIDSFSGNRVYTKAIRVMNKIDKEGQQKNLLEKLQAVPISAETEVGLDSLKEIIWERLQLVRIYLVRKDSEPNFNDSMIVKVGDTLGDVAYSIGSEFASDKKLAKIWGSVAKYPGQEVSLTTPVFPEMQVRFV